jgi:hypothetical protein
MSTRKRWGFVQLGLLLVAISACVIAGGAGLLAIARIIGMIADFGSGAGQGAGTAFKIIARIGEGLLFGGGIAALVGYVFCIFVPNRNGTLVFAIVAVCLGGINLIFNLLCRIIPMFQDLGFLALVLPGFGVIKTSLGGAFAFSIFIVLFYFAEFIIFPLFLVAVAKTVRARWLRDSAMGLVIFGGVTAGLQLLSIIMIFVTLNSATHPKGLVITTDIISVVASLAFLGLMIWYSLLLFRSRDAVTP